MRPKTGDIIRRVDGDFKIVVDCILSDELVEHIENFPEVSMGGGCGFITLEEFHFVNEEIVSSRFRHILTHLPVETFTGVFEPEENEDFDEVFVAASSIIEGTLKSGLAGRDYQDMFGLMNVVTKEVVFTSKQEVLEMLQNSSVIQL